MMMLLHTMSLMHICPTAALCSVLRVYYIHPTASLCNVLCVSSC